MKINTLHTLSVLSVCSALTFASCGEAPVDSRKEAPVVVSEPRPAPELTELGSESPSYDESKLTIASIKTEKAGTDSTKVTFEFKVEGFELQAQTFDAGGKRCNNSEKGQHIHFILDNEPYKALYEPKNEIVLPNSTEHYLMAFLSRSYHESVKSKGAAMLLHFHIDQNGKVQKMDNPKTPMVFYSRPKGDYLGADTTRVLLDYYIWNCTLGADTNKIEAMLLTPGYEKQDTTIFKLEKWEPKFIVNMPTGKSTIIMTILDKNGNIVDGPNNKVTREFNLAAQEPMK